MLQLCPGAQAVASVSVQVLTALVQELAPRRYGESTARRLITLAQHTASSGKATAARATCLQILCEQLSQSQKNLARLETEIDHLLQEERGARGLASVPEFGPKTVAVLRAELGDVNRFQRIDQA